MTSDDGHDPTALVLVGGPPTDHDFDALGDALTDALSSDRIDGPAFNCTVTDDPAELTDRLADPASRPDLVAVLALRWTMAADRYAAMREQWAFSPDERTRDALATYVNGGGGLLAVHTACICFDDWPGWGDLLGASWAWGRSSHPPPGPSVVTPTGTAHPITDGVERFTIDDEIYGFLDHRPGLQPLLCVSHGGVDHPVLWARAHGAGRVVVDTLGHSVGSMRHRTHRLLLRRSAQWALASA